MGILRSDDDHALIALGARTLIGRAAHCAVRIDDRQISAEHAALRWTGKEWQLRDLGSRNGTFVDGERLESGRGRALSSGVSVRFGPQRGFVLAHDGPPGAAAARETDQLLRVSEAEILSLPSADGMLAIVYEGSDGPLDRRARGPGVRGRARPGPRPGGRVLAPHPARRAAER
jgi:hypothetical protein